MKLATNLSVGDRTLPLEADVDAGPSRSHSLIGTAVEVSPIAGGDLQAKIGKGGKVTGVFLRYGEVVAFEVEIDGSKHLGALKDFYYRREYLEDLQPPTATSLSVREGLSHWKGQRDYWHDQTDGLEALCFDLASVTPRASPEVYAGGWRFLVPSPITEDRVVVDCRAPLHDTFWTLGVIVYPERKAIPIPANRIEDHWARVFSWAFAVASEFLAQGYPWERAVRSLRLRGEATTRVLHPLVNRELARAVEAKRKLTGKYDLIVPGQLSVAFSNVRLKAGTIGLLEPPTDRRPYSVMSVSPSAVKKDKNYLQQVVLHEVLHFVVGSTGGNPHNEEFETLSKALGLRKEHRD